jgi:glutamate 5-kinase
MFSKYNLSCAQVLITEDDMADSETFSQMCDTTMELLQLGCIPIINDNDAVTARTTPVYNEETSEVVWDNDVLASRLAIGLRADLLITLTDVDSLYSAPSSVSASLSDDPDADPVRIPVYHPDVTLVTRSPKVSNWTLLSDNGRGTFAGRTRMSEACLKAIVEACTSAVASGVRAAVVHTGHHPLSLLHILRGDDVGTLFIQKGAAMTSKL